MTPYHTYILILQVVSCVSVISSLSVIATFLFFHDMRDKFFMRIIAFISFADFLGSFPYMFADRPATGNWWCWLQGFMNAAAHPMSWLWTVVLMHFLYCIIANGQIPGVEYYRKAHLFGWGIPIARALLAQSCSNYARDETFKFEICVPNKEAGVIYHVVTYYVLLVGSVAYLIALWVKMKRLEEEQIKAGETVATSPMLRSYKVVKDSLKLYPLALIVCWTPHLISMIFVASGNADDVVDGVYLFGDCCKVLHGVATAFIFFFKSPLARKLWWKVFVRDRYSMKDSEIDMSSANSFSITNPTHDESVIS